MNFPPLIAARLLRRYKRFLADVVLEDASVETCFVANPGAMLGCAEPGSRVYLRIAESGKYRLRWTLTESAAGLICVDTSFANKLLYEAVEAQSIPELAGYREYIREMPFESHGRADLCCRVRADDMLARLWVEVKSVSYAQGRVALFPDSVSQRASRHMAELARLAREEERALAIFIVQCPGCNALSPADQIDPRFGAALRASAAAGVTILAIEAKSTLETIKLGRRLKVILPP